MRKVIAFLFLASIVLTSLSAPGASRAAAADLFFSEYIEGSSNNKALEIYNGTGGAVDLTAGSYNVQMFFNGNTSAGLTINLTGSVADGDVFVLAHGSADPAILAQADQTNSSGWFNGNDAVVLRKGTAVIDSIGQVGFDPGTEWGTGNASTADNTLRRKAAICAGDSNALDAFDPSTEWEGFATNTFDGLGSHTADCGTSTSNPVINEFSASTTGTDVEYVEIFGAPDTDYTAYNILEIEGDSGAAPGTVDEVISVGTTDANGFWLANLPANALENGTITLLLVSGFGGSLGNDLDTDDDGTFDVTPWDAIFDAVAVNDGGSEDLTYGIPALGPNYDGISSFAPGGASRIPDGFDTDAATDWVRNDFDLAGIPGFTGTPVVGEAYNTPGETNVVFVPPPEVCGDPFTPIYDIQGSGSASPLVGAELSTEGVVVGDFQPGDGDFFNTDLGGFHIQDATGDGDDLTSDGIFVFAPGAIDVNPGDLVRVHGTVSEFFNLTEIGATVVLQCSTGNPLPAVAELSLPVTGLDNFEPYEGMRVGFLQDLYISEYFNFDRFNEIVLTSDRQFQPTAVFEPGSSEAAALAQANVLGRITLDDGRSAQNPDPARHPNGEEFDLGNRFRGGDTVKNVTGVMDYAFGLYRIQPTQGADYTAANPRTGEPESVGGNLKVSSFNVLNYFLTLDDGVNDICGPDQDQECRGADNPEEFDRQRAKILSALAAIDADIFGLTEMENTTGVEPLADIVDGLNDELGAGTYAFIDTGTIGTDAIKVGIIYKTATVTPLGAYAILDSTVDPRFLDDKNRPALAQTFMENDNGAIITVALNHLKSKGSDCNDVGDPDTGDGSGNCNLTREAAAEALVDWLASDPTGSGDADFLIFGDLNSYDKEDPIDAILEGADDSLSTSDDYTDLIRQYQGEYAYSYVFDGQLGYLDYGLASSTLLGQVTGTTVWHINADEPDILDYDTSFKQPAQDALYEPNPYRSSDHDPVIIGLDLLHYPFDGFYAPVENPPALNVVNSGSSVPVQFSLGADFGLDIFFDDYPKSGEIDCDTGAPVGALEATDPAGASSLQYDPATDTYTYVWKTERSWARTCRQLVVILDDGTVRVANFSFAK